MAASEIKKTFPMQAVLDGGYQVCHSPLNLLNSELVYMIEQAPDHIAKLQMGMDKGLVQQGECGLMDQLE